MTASLSVSSTFCAMPMMRSMMDLTAVTNESNALLNFSSRSRGISPTNSKPKFTAAFASMSLISKPRMNADRRAVLNTSTSKNPPNKPRLSSRLFSRRMPAYRPNSVLPSHFSQPSLLPRRK